MTHTTPLFTFDVNGRLTITLDEGTSPIKVRPMRLFPMTDPEHWIALIDGRGEEILLLEDPQTLNAESSAALSAALQASEFVPQISRIIHISGNSVPCQWEVVTDRGDCVFVVKDEKDVRALSGGRILVVDAHGIRYQIANIAAIDGYSRRVIEWYV